MVHGEENKKGSTAGGIVRMPPSIDPSRLEGRKLARRVALASAICRFGLFLIAVNEFLSDHIHISRSYDPQPDVASRANDPNEDVVSNPNCVAFLACQNQHRDSFRVEFPPRGTTPFTGAGWTIRAKRSLAAVLVTVSVYFQSVAASQPFLAGIRPSFALVRNWNTTVFFPRI